jgi:hypothetical protein
VTTKLGRILLLATGTLIGFLSCAFLNYFSVLRFEPSLTVGNILQATATVFVGLLVAAYFQRHTNVDRKEKDILLRQLDLLLDAVTEFEKFKDGGVLIEITASLKKLSMKSKSVNEILAHLKYPADIISQTRFGEQIKKMRKLATETPIKQIQEHASKARCTSVVREGIIQLAEEKKLQLDGEIQGMKMRILKAQVCINKA